MIVRLTDRARDVIELARHEAADFRHDHIGTEHVLLGILREGGGIAEKLTARLRLDLSRIRKGVSLLNPISAKSTLSSSQLPFSHRLRGALKHAEDLARTVGHSEVGIGHLFLGLTQDEEGKAALLLINLGLDLKETRRDLLERLSAT